MTEGPRDALYQSKSYQLMHNYTRNCIRNGMQSVNDRKGYSGSLEILLFDSARVTSYYWSVGKIVH